MFVQRIKHCRKKSALQLNGTLAQDIPIANNRYYAYDLALDENGTIYIVKVLCYLFGK